MPHAPENIVRAGASAILGGRAAGEVIPCVGLEEPDATREQTRRDEVEEAGGHNQEDLERSSVATTTVEEPMLAAGNDMTDQDTHR